MVFSHYTFYGICSSCLMRMACWVYIFCEHAFSAITRPINIYLLPILNKSHPRQSARKVSSMSVRQNEGLLSCVNTVLLYFPRRSSGHDVIRIEARPLSMLTLSTWPRRVRHSSSDSLDRRTVDADSSACILVLITALRVWNAKVSPVA